MTERALGQLRAVRKDVDEIIVDLIVYDAISPDLKSRLDDGLREVINMIDEATDEATQV
jgi:hypothetical protein